MGASLLGNNVAGRGAIATSQERGVNRVGEGAIAKRRGRGIFKSWLWKQKSSKSNIQKTKRIFNAASSD